MAVWHELDLVLDLMGVNGDRLEFL